MIFIYNFEFSEERILFDYERISIWFCYYLGWNLNFNYDLMLKLHWWVVLSFDMVFLLFYAFDIVSIYIIKWHLKVIIAFILLSGAQIYWIQLCNTVMIFFFFSSFWAFCKLNNWLKGKIWLYDYSKW